MHAFRLWALAVAIVSVVRSGAALAEAPRQVRFDYARQEGASSCPELPAVKAGVAARLGYEPFDERAADLVRATIRTMSQGLEARIELIDGNGILKAERRLVSHQRDCSELASSVELAVSIAIDPFGIGASEHAAPPAVAQIETPPQPVAPPVVLAAPAPPVAPPLTTRIEAGLVGSAAEAPSYGLGARAAFALGGESFLVGLEGQASFSARRSLAQGYASAALWTASLVPCARHRALAACALARAGVMRGSGEGLADARSTNLFYAALGLRVSATIPLASVLALVAHADTIAPLTEEQLRVDNEVVWTSPRVAVALGLAVAAVFP